MKISQHRHQRHKNQDAFTMIEVIVVLAIIGIMLPIIFSVLFTVAKQQSKIFRLSEAKQQGDYALNFMKMYIQKNANEVFQDSELQAEVCSNSNPPDDEYTALDGENFYFSKKNVLSDYFHFRTLEYEFDSVTNERFYYLIFNDNGEELVLTTGKVSIQNFYLSCFKKNAASPPFIFISFIVYYKTSLAQAAPEDIALLKYKGVIKMR